LTFLHRNAHFNSAGRAIIQLLYSSAVATADRIDILSKRDMHFFNTSSLVIGILVIVTIALFAFARAVADRTQARDVYADPLYQASVEERIKPFVRIAVAGQDNSALVMRGLSSGVSVAMEIPKDGAALYESVCKVCHEPGLAGSPKLTDKANWAPRIKQGQDMLYRHALEGYTGTAGTMPKKGGRTDLNDELIKLGVDYMVLQAR
jgi:cytochrome c5